MSTAPVVANMLPYQSRGIRWTIGIIASVAGVFVGFGGEQFHDSPSLVFVRELGLPWPVWGCLFLIYASLITFGRPLQRFYGFILGAGLYAFFTMAFFYNALVSDNPPPPFHKLNPVLLGGMACAVAFHAISAWFASRLADKERT